MTHTKTDLGEMTAAELSALFRARHVSPVEVTGAALARIDRFNEAVNAYCHVDRDGALTMAKASEARWMKDAPLSPVDGVPSSIKDLTYVAGMPTRKGSLSTNDIPADVDAPFTARMREAGAVILGKTTSPEFGWKGVTDSPLTGITRNPWNTSRTSGGSSGGAAAAAALNMGVLHQGSDAGGSIRIPCGFCGVFGIKPTFGTVPQWPASAMTTLSHMGPVTRTVADSALMLNVVARPDGRDWYAGATFPDDWMKGLDKPLTGLRVAYSRTLGYVSVRGDVRARVDAAVAVLSSLGAIVTETDPGFADPIEMFNTLWFAGAAKLIESIPEAQREAVDPGLLAIAEQGREIPIVRYMQAMDARAVLGEAMARFHEHFDVLVTPMLPITAFAAGQNAPEGDKNGDWVAWTPFTFPFNLTQQPAASVPCGLADDGLPVGLHVVAAKFRDDLVMQVCAAFERACPQPFPSVPKMGA
ncbi:MAG: amidase [Rhodospirillaceae bacterium]|nr:amidase [Rhodospirillaceae bacterium]